MFDAVEGAELATVWIERRAVAGTTARRLGFVLWGGLRKFACCSDALTRAMPQTQPAGNCWPTMIQHVAFLHIWSAIACSAACQRLR